MITHREYEVVPYDSKWPAMYEKEAAIVREIFGELAKDIQHIGSTSIPGMQAKPLIDVLVLVDDLTCIGIVTPNLEAAGYVAYGDRFNVGGCTFSREKGNHKVVNVHVFPNQAHYVGRFLVTRDYLRAHPDKAQEYSELKIRLKNLHPDNYQAYVDGKHEFLEQAFEEAILSHPS